MEYKLYNSNTLKSVQVNEDTNLIFELAQANKTKVFLNTLLYSSQYGCPISFSLIRNLNSTTDIGFGAGAVLDFMYKLSAGQGKLVITHPTGDTEDFVYNQVTIENPDENVEIDYFYSTSTSSFIKRIKENGTVAKYYYTNASFVAVFNSSLGVLDNFSRNGETDNQFISIIYNSDKSRIIRLENKIDEKEIVEFMYYSNKVEIIASKKIDNYSYIEIEKITINFESGEIDAVQTTKHGKNTSIINTIFTKTNTMLLVKNEITNAFCVLEYVRDKNKNNELYISSVQMNENYLTVTYVDNYETKVQYNGMWEKYFFDYNNNLQHIENSVGEVKTFQYDNTEKRLLLSESGNLYINNHKNYNDYLDNTEKSITSYNSYSCSSDIDTTCPVGSEITNIEICETYEDEESGFSFRFNKPGKRFDVENLVLWYKITTCPENAAHNDIQAYLHFYKGSSNGDILIRTEPILMNTTIQNKWLFNILAAQAAEDYDYVDVYFSVNKPGYVIDINVELMSDSFLNIYKYDEYGRIVETLNGKQIQKYKYNEDNQLVASSNYLLSYDQFGKPCIVVNSNNIQHEITRDEYGNVTLSKVYNKDKSKYIKSTKEYTDKEHLTTENTETNENLTYLYDNKKRMYSVLTTDNQKTLSFIENDNANYGKVSKIMHSYKNITNYINTDGAQFTYDAYGNIEKVQHLNLASAPDYTYSYTYDTQNRLTKITIGNSTIVEYTYSLSNNRKSITMKLNSENIVYNYDENERLISKSNDSGILYEYTYDDDTTRIKSIKNVSNNETISFEYDGILLSKVLLGTFKTVYTYNNNKNILLEKKYYNENLVSIEKNTDSSLNSSKDGVMSFENEVLQNEGDNVYLTTFVKEVHKYKYLDTIYEKDVTKDLKGKLSNYTIEHAPILPENKNYCFDGLPCISFVSGDTPLLYSFIDNKSLTNKYSVFFGYKLDSLSTSIPIMQFSNGSQDILDRITLYVDSNLLRICLYDSGIEKNIQKIFSVNNTVGSMNFIAVNVSYTKTSSTSYIYTVEVFYNGVSVGKIENVTLRNVMNQLYLMGNSGNSVNVGKITTVFVKNTDHIISTNIAQYSSMLFDIYNRNILYTHNFNKKIRLFNTSLPVICFDNNFDSIDGTIKPFKLSFGKNILSILDCFCPDPELGENVLVLKNQTLSYDFNLSTSGIAGVRFKRINGVETNIFSLNDTNLYIHVHNSSSGEIMVTVNSNTYYPTTLNTSWNNIFVKWEKVVSSGSIDECIYNLYLYVNGTSYSLGEHNLTNNVSKMIMSVGKCYLNSADNPGCFGYVEKAVGCSTSNSISTLNSLFNNFGEGVLNEYDEFNQKTKKHIYTSSSDKITQSYTFDISSEGRVMGKLTREYVTLAQNNSLTYYYSYNLDKTISKQRIHNTSTNSYIDKVFTYDNKKQLTQYSDGTNAYVYTYDNMGNITKITKNGTTIHTATFKNGILINSINGYTINYDSSGVYPISKYSGSSPIEEYIWEDGKLVEFKYSQQNRRICFEYSANGLRTSKKEYYGTSLTNTTKYYYNANGLLVYETRTSNNVKLEYLYDAEGTLYGVYYNGTPYYYIKDALGNIMYLVDSSKKIVTRFNYEGAYGKHNVIDVNSVGSNHISFINPFRYKGYYYDVETGLFWLSSRYYSPEFRRFL